MTALAPSSHVQTVQPDYSGTALLSPRERQLAGLKRLPKGTRPLNKAGVPLSRPLGSRHRLSEKFIQALANDFQRHGKSSIEAVRKSDPSTYMRVIASLLPAKVDLDLHSSNQTDAMLSELTYAELQRRILALDQRKRDLEAITVEVTPVTVEEPSGESPASE